MNTMRPQLKTVLVALGFAVGLLPWSPSLRAQQAMAPAQAASWHFVQTGKIDFTKVLPPPPAPGSLAAEADLLAVLQAQDLRTYADESWARRVAVGDLFDFSDILGSWFSRANLPVTAALLEDVDGDLGPGVDASKNAFARPRPFVADARVHPCVERPEVGGRFQYSYPSGHTMQFFVEAAVLAEIFPDRREALFGFAGRMAWGRVIGGVHYPTDLVAGRLAAEVIVGELDKSEAFQGELAKARGEVGTFQAARQDKL